MAEYVTSMNSFTTFKTKFCATLVQADTALYAELFELEIDFVWNTTDIAMGNAAFLKIKFFLEDIIHQSVFTHKNAQVKLGDLENSVVMFPHVPTSDIIAMTLHAKLNAIADGACEVLSVKVTSLFDNPSMSYTYADDEYPAMPGLEEWIGQKEYYYTVPWWHRATPETEDYEVDEDSDLTSLPEYDTVLEDIQKAVLGELKLLEPKGEVIKIHDWKPEIVKD